LQTLTLQRLKAPTGEASNAKNSLSKKTLSLNGLSQNGNDGLCVCIVRTCLFTIINVIINVIIINVIIIIPSSSLTSSSQILNCNGVGNGDGERDDDNVRKGRKR